MDEGSSSRRRDAVATKAFHRVDFVATTPVEAVDTFIARVVDGRLPTSYRFINAYSMAVAGQDPAYLAVLCGEGINLPDGRPLTAVLDRTDPATLRVEQVRGPGFFEATLDRGRRHGLRHYFLGGPDTTLAMLRSQVEQRYPGTHVVGMYSPPFRPMTVAEQRAQDDAIASSGAHVVWVALGTPKQDVEALRILRATGISTAAVGAAFDFAAGTKRQAPRWMHAVGLEWSFRLVCEPRRLWRRYLFGNIRFVLMVLRRSGPTRRA